MARGAAPPEGLALGRVEDAALVAEALQGFHGYGLPILRIRHLVPRMVVCVVFSCLAILRIEGCLNSTL